MKTSSAALLLSGTLLVCWAFTLGLTWAPCYSQVCPEAYHPLGTRMHIVAYYGLLTTILLTLLLRASSFKVRRGSEHHLTRRELPFIRKRISVGGLVVCVWVSGVVLATSAFWTAPLLDYWTAKLAPLEWMSALAQLVLTGIFAHHADILLGLLLIPVGRNSILGRTLWLHQHTLLYAHKLLAYAMLLAVLAHGVTYYTFVADWIALPWSSEARKKVAIDLENPNIAFSDIEELGRYYTVTLFTGTLTLALMLVIVVSSLPALRRRAYNTFYYIHLIFSILVFVGAGMHSSTNLYFLLPGLVLWVVDWAWRLFRGDTGLVQTLDGTLHDAGRGWYRIGLPASATKLPQGLSGNLDREAAEEKQVVWHPLQTYYLNIPSVSKVQNHAFSAAVVGSPLTGPAFLFKRTSTVGQSVRREKRTMKKEWTWKLSRQAEYDDDTETPHVKQLRVRAEGPYFPPVREFETADHILCVVAGTGITGALSLANWYLQHRAQESKASFTIVWTIRNASMALVSEWQSLLARSTEVDRRLRLRTHVSSEYGCLDVNRAIRAELGSGGEPGRGRAWVYVSGPRGFLTAAEDTCYDVEAELRVAKKAECRPDVAFEDVTHYAAKWEV